MKMPKRQSRARRKAKANRLWRWQRVPLNIEPGLLRSAIGTGLKEVADSGRPTVPTLSPC